MSNETESQAEALDILLVTRKWPPAMGGMETWSVEVASEFQLHHNLSVHALPGKQNGDAPNWLALLGFGLKELIRLPFRNRSDVAIGGDMAIWPLIWVCRAKQKMLAAHGTDVGFACRHGVLPFLYRSYMRLGAALLKDIVVIANSRSTSDNARKLGFSSIKIIPLAARTFQLPPIQQPESYLLFAGRLIQSKGCSWLVREVLPQLPNLKLKIAGTVWDESERAVFSHPQVEYLGVLTQAELLPVMRNALAVVLPNIRTGSTEGFGLVVVEASSVGAVVIASDIGGFRDSVIADKTGFLIEPENPRAWIDAITEVEQWTSAQRYEFTLASQCLAAESFNWQRVVKEIVEVFVSMTADSK
jgi:phosphatidyl-myo-inositol dimannoside synthase